MDNSIISALGGGSGINTTNLVNQLVEIERAPQQNRIDSQKEKLEAQISAYGTLKSSLSTFQGLLTPLSDNDTFNSRSASIPDTTVISANSLDANAQPGTYQIEVEAIAQQHSLAANTAYADKDAAAGLSGTLEIKLGTWTYDGSDNPIAPFNENESQPALSIEITAEDSIQSIADKINEAEGDVQANVLLVDGKYQLTFSAPSGADNALKITGIAELTYDVGATTNVTQTQKGQDAEIKVNGLSVFRSTNEVDDVIAGFDFSLNKASPGEKITFSISEDKGTAEQAVRDFVEGYNALYGTLQNLTGVSRDEETNQTRAGDLSTDGSAKALLGQIRSLISNAVPGVDDFNALTNIGIRTKLDGTLEIVDSEFNDAISNQFEQVKALFAPQTSSSNGSVDVSIGSYATNTSPGTYSASITTAPSKGVITAGANFSTSLNTTSSPGDYTFKLSVNGAETDTLTLAGEFTSAEEIRGALQGLINNDASLKESGDQVDVVIDGSNFKIQSRIYGSSSSVTISEAGDQFRSATGFTVASSSINGVDVAGTINGEAAFGAGEVLLPKIDTDPYGLNLTVGEGASGDFSITYSRGFAGEMSRLIDSFLENNGAIKVREESINRQLTGLTDDQENLDRKMAILNERLTAQYLAMEQIISSFNTTRDSLDGILDRLPFTAKKS